MNYLSKTKPQIKNILRSALASKRFISRFFSQLLVPIRITYFQKAIVSNPKDHELYYELGKALKDKGDIDSALENYERAIYLFPKLEKAYSEIANIIQEKRNFNEAISYLVANQAIDDPELKAMLLGLGKAKPIYHPSRFWIYYAVLNIYQIKFEGINNFKRTINQNYFNWIFHGITDQLHALEEKLDVRVVPGNHQDETNAKYKELPQKPSDWTDSQWNQYKQFLYLLWEFSHKIDRLQILSEIEEPLLGNPLAIYYKGLLISQDICNSVMEVNSAMEGFGNELPNKLKVAELGAGYGRIAYVLLQTQKNIQVTIIDIPPALYVSQVYLSQLFPNLKVFKYREFSNYEEIKEELDNSSIAFLSPEQIEQIPNAAFDLFINVSSLHEMTAPQIELWMNHINRVCSGFFYSKQWISSRNDKDDIIIHRDSYPIKNHWREIFNRTCPVQEKFFEALYKIH